MSGGMEEAAQEILMKKLEAQDDGVDFDPIVFEPEFDIDIDGDVVNNPSHYRQGDVECIDAIASAVVGLKGIEAVYVANIIKYVWRFKHKNGIEDLYKLRWYTNKLVALNE